MGVGGLAVLAALAGHAFSQAVERPVRGTFSASYIGEGGGPAVPTGSAADYMENGSRQLGGHGTHGPMSESPVPERQAQPEPAPGLPGALPGTLPMADPRSGPWKTIPLARATPDEKAAPETSPAGDRSRYSLWEGLAAPLELPAAKASESSADDASELGRSDYETHILGMKKRRADSTDLAAPALPPAPTQGAAAALAPEPAREVFVMVDLHLRSDPNEYRDALAGLASRALFRPDPRFSPAVPPAGGRVSVAGWLPPASLGAALQVPSVVRLETSPRAPRRGEETVAESPLLLGIRIPGADPSAPEARAAVKSALEQLAGAGFKREKEVGYQKPGGADAVVIVAGRAPIKALGRVMAHPAVVKTAPWIEPEPAAAPAPSPLMDFLAYSAQRSPLLLLLTGLLALWTAAWAVIRFAEISVPYK